MNKKLDIGDTHGLLTVEDVTREEDENGQIYYVYSLGCRCGKKLYINARKWHSSQKDCGCGDSIMELSSFINATIPTRVRKEVSQFASKQSISFSKAVSILLELGLTVGENL